MVSTPARISLPRALHAWWKERRERQGFFSALRTSVADLWEFLRDGVAQENLRNYKSDKQRCFIVESVCSDAREFVFPMEPTVLYLFDPLPASGLSVVIANLEQSLRKQPREFYVLYHNPVLEHALGKSSLLRKIGGTHQYSVFARE